MYSRGVQTTYTYRSSTFATECNIEATAMDLSFRYFGENSRMFVLMRKTKKKARFENDKLDTSLQRGCVSEANRNLSHSF